MAAAVCGCGSSAPALPPLHPNRVGPESIVTSAAQIISAPQGEIAVLQQLGVDRVHVPMYWNAIAPSPNAVHKPHFNASDPADYPAAGWAPYDAIVRDLQGTGVGIDLALVDPPPRWASGPGAPHPATQTEWRPSAVDYGQFVKAVATRYSGHYVPPGATKPLPRVSFWSIWNEPDLGEHLAPEAIDHSQVEVAPRYYRALVDAAWSAFQSTGHGHDTILIGELAPAGIRSGAGVGDFNSMPPLRFLRALYCVNSSYQPLRGAAATIRGCPATAAGSAQFAAQNPGLFKASGLADHPYPQGLPPNQVTPGEPDYAELGDMGTVETALDRMQRDYGSDRKLPIWSTEFGYQTKPPDPESGTVSPTTAAYYMNWAEYITWEDPRLASFDQYLLVDPTNGIFATGLLTDTGAPKPAFYAYRMPIYLPVNKTTKGQPLVVWGCVRPAPDAARSTHHTQYGLVQFQAGGKGPWKTVQRVPITNIHGYFEVRQTFSGSGDVRIAWTYPHHGQQVYSRTVVITLQ